MRVPKQGHREGARRSTADGVFACVAAAFIAGATILGCHTGLVEREIAPAPVSAPASARVNVLSWNVAKGARGAVTGEIARLVEDEQIDVVCLQEGTLSLAPSLPGYGAWFGPSFEPLVPLPFFGSEPTGVLTLARSPARELRMHRSRDRELGLFTPKAALVTAHRVGRHGSERFETLLVVNVHALAFTGLSPVGRQVEALAEEIGRHSGPVVVCGDFNTWSEERERRLVERFTKLGLVEIPFDVERTTATFWLLDRTPLDRIFFRGLEPGVAAVGRASARPEGRVVPGVWSSDHRPLVARLRCCTTGTGSTATTTPAIVADGS